MGHVSNTRRVRGEWMVMVFLLLQYLSYAEGEVYVSQRMRAVTTFNTSSNTICVQSLREQPKLALRIRLMVHSIYTNEVIEAGEVNVRQRLLSPVYSNHKITIQHIEDDTQMFGVKVHVLKVLLDGEEVEFVKENIDAYAHVYRFDHVVLLMRGTADIYPCEITSPSSTTPAITTTTTTTTTPMPTTVPTTTTEEPPIVHVVPDGGGAGGSTDEEAPAESPSDVVLHNAEGTDDENSGLSEPKDSEDESDTEPWWHFVFVLGDFKGIPILILLIIVFCVGLGIGSVGTILCEQYCCCSCEDEDDEENKLHDASFDHRMIARTDFHDDSNNPMYTTSLTAGRITKDNISSPIQPTAPRTNTYDVSHYQSPRDREWSREQREHPHTNSSDETIPLNVPLPRENQMTHSSGSYDPYDPYRETSLNL